ncbi:hypothetical protein [Streptomonospora nanhaiensis]|uniref:hypothetical protein n=1 Tax=Streptomonospora nanhaiensis TaxID=1323731 RepID=UPI001C990515|nr:hypothetical protein [Streptomonospora nanhaiensis]MBX9388555.1 hypothetical protein [Streptomonospora nanhaiensis]
MTEPKGSDTGHDHRSAEGGDGAFERDKKQEHRYVRGYQGEGGQFAPTQSHRGRIGSWLAVGVIVVGFVLGGLGIALGLNWWLIGAAVVLMAVGGVLCFVTDIFTDVVLDSPHHESEEPHNTPLPGIMAHDRPLAELRAGHRAATDT